MGVQLLQYRRQHMTQKFAQVCLPNLLSETKKFYTWNSIPRIPGICVVFYVSPVLGTMYILVSFGDTNNSILLL